MGDIAGLLTAVGYGAYTVLLRHLCPKDEDRMSTQLLFGYVGLLNMIFLFPVAAWVIVSSRDRAPFEYGPNDGSTAMTTLTWTIDWPKPLR
jgi:drug/metabolite transporter (DMT)-like permease